MAQESTSAIHFVTPDIQQSSLCGHYSVRLDYLAPIIESLSFFQSYGLMNIFGHVSLIPR